MPKLKLNPTHEVSDWTQLKSGTTRRDNLPFRDPLNKERRFLPLRLDDAPIKGGGAIPTPALLAKVVDMLEQAPMEERLQEYRTALIITAVIGKIDVRPNAGSNSMNS